MYDAQKYRREARVAYHVFTNVANRKLALMDMKFIRHFEVFKTLYNTGTLVGFLIQIAIELRDMLTRMTSKFLRDYLITRCYEEVAIDIGTINSFFLRRQIDKERLQLLQNYKVRILNELIPIEDEKLNELQDELEKTKGAIT